MTRAMEAFLQVFNDSKGHTEVGLGAAQASGVDGAMRRGRSEVLAAATGSDIGGGLRPA